MFFNTPAPSPANQSKFASYEEFLQEEARKPQNFKRETIAQLQELVDGLSEKVKREIANSFNGGETITDAPQEFTDAIDAQVAEYVAKAKTEFKHQTAQKIVDDVTGTGAPFPEIKEKIVNVEDMSTKITLGWYYNTKEFVVHCEPDKVYYQFYDLDTEDEKEINDDVQAIIHELMIDIPR